MAMKLTGEKKYRGIMTEMAGERKENRENRKDKNILGNEGMMTVEAAAIVPILLIIVIVQVLFSLFLIDMSVAKSEALRIAEETSAAWKTDARLADGSFESKQLISRNKNFLRQRDRSKLNTRAESRLRKRVLNRLNTASLSRYGVSIKGERVCTQVSVRYAVPFGGGKRYTEISGWTFTCKGKADIGNEEELLRQVMADSK